MESNAVITQNRLDFECANSPYSEGHKMFRIGTCDGQWGCTSDSYFILSVINKEAGNGHLNDVFEWFEYSCKRDNKNLLVLECMNNDFYNHLLNKRGFVSLDTTKENCIKVFNKKSYKKLLRKGNEILKRGPLTCI